MLNHPQKLVLSLSKYTATFGYSFGMLLPERTWTSDSASYRYGFNTQEKVDEITAGHHTAEYWEYDSRLGRRWNVDPITYPWQSSYAVNNNCPIYFSDPMGLKGNQATTGGGDQTYSPSSNKEPSRMDDIINKRKQSTTPTTEYGTGGLGSFGTSQYSRTSSFIPSTFSINNNTTRTLPTSSSTNRTFTPTGATRPTTSIGTTGLNTTSSLSSGLITSTPYRPNSYHSSSMFYSPPNSIINTIGKTTFIIGALGSTLENAPGSFRVFRTENRFSPKYYPKMGGVGQRPVGFGIKTYDVATYSRYLGWAGFAITTGSDLFYGMPMYYKHGFAHRDAVHPGKAGLNFGMGLYGMYYNPIAASLYFGVDAFYPGGWPAAGNQYNRTQKGNQEVLGSGFRLIPSIKY